MTDNTMVMSKLEKIDQKMDKMIEANGQQNERISKNETQLEYLEKMIRDNKDDADRRFGTVWITGKWAIGLAITLLAPMAAGLVILWVSS